MQWYAAPAKLNLFLHVLGRRADGYHLLQSVFRLIDHCDEVGIAVRGDGLLRRIDPLPGVPEDTDLCLRAARLLRDHAASRLGVEQAARLGAEIGLRKRIPIGGGLGGGSSNAATALLVLNRVWGLGFSRAELQAMALRLGADVPFFVFGESALAEGVGERLLPIGIEPAWYLVLVPRVAVSTKEVFSDNSLTRNGKALTIPPFFHGLGANDLESVVVRRYPEVAMHIEWLRKRCASARMTGSGACVFGAFEHEDAALAVRSALPQSMHGFVARGLDRHPLHDWAENGKGAGAD